MAPKHLMNNSPIQRGLRYRSSPEQPTMTEELPHYHTTSLRTRGVALFRKSSEDSDDPTSPGCKGAGAKAPPNCRRYRRRIRACAKGIFFLGASIGCTVLAILIASRPYFPNFFEEFNFYFHHVSKGADMVLLKHRKRPNQKILYYLHLSKCGGTSIMDAARASGLSVPIRNGLAQRDWRCCGEDDSLQAQADYFKSSPFDLVANENDMYDAMDTDHYDYIVTLRNSRLRYKSQWSQWQRDPFLAMEKMDLKAFAAWFGEDNFMFRKICGSNCRGVPKFQIPRKFFQYTLERLGKFDSILFLETFQEDYAKFAKKHDFSAPEQKKRFLV